MRGAWLIHEVDVIIGQLLAEGGFGKVFSGQYGGHRVAIKVLKQPLDPELSGPADDFARECATLMAIRHTHLLIFFGAGTMSGNRPFMVTEFMALGSLKTVLADSDRELHWVVRIRIAAQVAGGVAHLHSLKIVHRDLKSDNVLPNEQVDAKVADFGTSKLATTSRSRFNTATGETSFGGGRKLSDMTSSWDGQASDFTQSVAFQATMTKGVGTPLWMAPELYVGGIKYGAEVDVYSFGMIMWELATRKIPWADDIAEKEYLHFFLALSKKLDEGARPKVPAEAVAANPEFVALMRACWTTDPTARPGTAAVAQQLGALRSD